MKKECENCLYCSYDEEEDTKWCNRYDCQCNEVAKENENPSCWEEFPADYYDMHTCEFENGYCKICGKIQYKSMLYCKIFGCDD